MTIHLSSDDSRTARNGSSAAVSTIAKTALITGPDATTSVTFNTPSQPGKYYFQCDVHPFMNGFRVVK